MDSVLAKTGTSFAVWAVQDEICGRMSLQIAGIFCGML